MKLALISPKGPLYRHNGGIFKKSLRAAPLTLTTLAALIPENLNVEVELYDEGIEEIPELDVDMVAMTVITGSAMRSYALAEEYMKRGITVVIGGPHVTLMPDEAAQHADSIITGYAEVNWPCLLRDFSLNKLKNKYTMATDFNLQDPALLPYPRRDLLNGKNYNTTHTFEATRGCVHECDFCVVPSAWGRKPFQKPIDHVIADIKQSGAKRLVFYDLNLIANRHYAVELFKALIPLNISWFGLSTTLIDDKLAELMARSGCKGLLIGFESISKSVLKESAKVFNQPDNYRDLIVRLQKQGIMINGTFVFGNDEDRLENFDMIKDFVLDTGIELPRFSILTPFPGTPLFTRLKEEGRILNEDWSLYDGQHVVFQPRHMSPDELVKGHEKLWKDVYSYSSILKRTSRQMLRQIAFSPVIFGANIGYRFYARNLSRFYTCMGGVI
ncbi:MAG: radical SAM protein [Lentisphaeria bacterium]|nr:radical SAM protein [Lentisphaeria bacterium]NQZ69428.1 radical SAM protein [Lentisphaeria bacterium]